MKKFLFILFFMLCSCLVSCSENSIDKNILISGKTAQYFTDEKIQDSDIVSIVSAGINATSAMNKQDWHFSVVTNSDLLNEFKNKMSENMPAQMKNQPNAKSQFGDSPLAIIVSCVDKGEFDAGLATQNIFDYAVLSGYGAKIVSSPTRMINENYKDKLDIPSNMNAVAVVMIGKERKMDGVDGITQASTRKEFDEVVTMVE